MDTDYCPRQARTTLTRRYAPPSPNGRRTGIRREKELNMDRQDGQDLDFPSLPPLRGSRQDKGVSPPSRRWGGRRAGARQLGIRNGEKLTTGDTDGYGWPSIMISFPSRNLGVLGERKSGGPRMRNGERINRRSRFAQRLLQDTDFIIGLMDGFFDPSMLRPISFNP